MIFSIVLTTGSKIKSSNFEANFSKFGTSRHENQSKITFDLRWYLTGEIREFWKSPNQPFFLDSNVTLWHHNLFSKGRQYGHLGTQFSLSSQMWLMFIMRLLSVISFFPNLSLSKTLLRYHTRNSLWDNYCIPLYKYLEIFLKYLVNILFFELGGTKKVIVSWKRGIYFKLEQP